MFSSLLDEGYDILHIAFSSALSGSCSVATTVARDLCEERQGANIRVVDSLCASLGRATYSQGCEDEGRRTINR